MIRIAVVEDDSATAQATEGYLGRYAAENGVSFQIDLYPSAETLLDGYTPRYELILLDIRLEGGMTGMDAAQELRKLDTSVQIIFITSLARYAVKSYEVGALDFMVKPVTYYQFAMKLDKAVRVIRRSEDVNLAVPTARGIKVLPSRDITFLEVSDHDLVYHTEAGQYRTRGSLGKTEEQLRGHSFLRTAVSHLVNLRYAAEIDGNMLILTTGDRLPISRSRKKEVLAGLASYLGGTL